MLNTYVIVRTINAGVFAGTLTQHDGEQATLTGARRIWYWAGAATLSELAVKGPGNPDACKFPCAMPEVMLTQVIEIIACTDDAKTAIEAVPEWTAQ